MSEFVAIFFDVDDTLFTTMKFHKEACHAAMDEVEGMLNNLYDDEKQATIETILSKEDLYKLADETYNDFRVGYRELFGLVLRRMKFEGTPPNLDPMVMAMLEAKAIITYDQHWLTLMKGCSEVKNTLLKLKEVGYKLGIITNGAPLLQAYKFAKLDIGEYFDRGFVHISDVIGMKKPNHCIFQTILKKLNLEPYNCVYVGDDPKNDIEAASKAGMITVHIKREGGENIDKAITQKACFTMEKSLKGLKSCLDSGNCEAFENCDNPQCPIYKSKKKKKEK